MKFEKIKVGDVLWDVHSPAWYSERALTKLRKKRPVFERGPLSQARIKRRAPVTP